MRNKITLQVSIHKSPTIAYHNRALQSHGNERRSVPISPYPPFNDRIEIILRVQRIFCCNKTGEDFIDERCSTLTRDHSPFGLLDLSINPKRARERERRSNEREAMTNDLEKAISTIGVIGAGQMGSGIAQVAATAGFSVLLHDSDTAALGRAEGLISSSLRRLASKGLISQAAPDEAMKRLKLASSIQELCTADLVIEAIIESEAIKKTIFVQLDKILKPSAILASNTSSISITRLASATSRPSQVIGMHFMNPPPIMKLIEIVRGADTSDEVFATIKSLSERMGKIVICSQDYPGFIVNRILMPMINEAFHTLYTGVATKEDIDTGMKLGTNHPMGPLELADFIGLDVCLSILRVLHNGLGDDKYSPCPLLVQYVDAGRLGRKRGIGVYSYQKSSNAAKPEDVSRQQE
ncbi:hypothetical protein LUZ61_002565 [Rhynchospora tenuis]|uniref:3-hydroxybutyryl-CoA dehydrogenase n=1 Tax=Rhynchospora tenuis TaxID=198213 RepID=A0AAD6ES08_9POAL|nr:hypothetical protein LUZ61_002565 [Rhynchospora tenuis]